MNNRSVPPHRCDICGDRFWAPGKLADHCTQMHQEIAAELRCHLCDRRFRFQYQLTAHLRSNVRAHPAPVPARCSHCGKSFLSQWSATQHERDFHVQREFACRLCDAVFDQREAYKQHIKEVHNDKQIECSICHRFFKKTINPKKHLDKRIC